MTTSCHKIPRLYTPQPLNKEGAAIELDQDQAHYIRNVMRMAETDQLRLFNGIDGEWLATITQIKKKSALLSLSKHLKPQPSTQAHIHLIFAPIKKQRLDILIEKAIELGATHLHPVLTHHTENRHIKIERINAQIIEATEQCERLDLAKLSPLTPMPALINQWKHTHAIHWAAERIENASPLDKLTAPCAYLIGPEGGFSEEECTLLKASKIITPISLGTNILRAETACLYCLSRTNINNTGE